MGVNNRGGPNCGAVLTKREHGQIHEENHINIGNNNQHPVGVGNSGPACNLVEGMMNIDREIAEKVMGWHVEDYPENHWVDKRGLPEYCCQGYGSSNMEFWHPTTDTAQAFKVVEKMREKSLWLSLVQQAEKHPVWKARFSFGGMAVGDRTRGIAEADTPAMAICLAALKAIGGN